MSKEVRLFDMPRLASPIRQARHVSEMSGFNFVSICKIVSSSID
jgi:hypothetical protein